MGGAVNHPETPTDLVTFEHTLSYSGGGSRLKRYTGSYWVAVHEDKIKNYNGVSWAVKPMKYYDGVTFQNITL